MGIGERACRRQRQQRVAEEDHFFGAAQDLDHVPARHAAAALHCVLLVLGLAKQDEETRVDSIGLDEEPLNPDAEPVQIRVSIPHGTEQSTERAHHGEVTLDHALFEAALFVTRFRAAPLGSSGFQFAGDPRGIWLTDHQPSVLEATLEGVHGRLSPRVPAREDESSSPAPDSLGHVADQVDAGENPHHPAVLLDQYRVHTVGETTGGVTQALLGADSR